MFKDIWENENRVAKDLYECVEKYAEMKAIEAVKEDRKFQEEHLNEILSNNAIVWEKEKERAARRAAEYVCGELLRGEIRNELIEASVNHAISRKDNL